MKKIDKIKFEIAGFIFLTIFILIIIHPQPTLTGKAVSVVTPDYIELKWQRQTEHELLSQMITVAKECKTQDFITRCDWQYQELELDALSFRDYEIHGEENELKFYQIVSKVKFSGNGTSCKPQCMPRPECFLPTTASYVFYCEDEDYAWYDLCTGERLKIAACSTEQQAYCCFQDTQEQGWYNTTCELLEVTKVTPSLKLIAYDDECQNPIGICTEKSDIFVKFTQPFFGNKETKDTGINWLVATKDTIVVPKLFDTVIEPFATHELESASDLLETKALDYIAYWDASQQYYYGAAYGKIPWGIELVTGEFALEQYNPYFIGAKRDGEMTWVGRMPQRKSIDLRHVLYYLGQIKENQNFIVLPFDTKIKTASQLCNPEFSGVLLDPEKAIYEWDAIAQQEVPAGTGASCQEAQSNDYTLKPGKVYKIYVNQDTIWDQV